jgi:hypothetical protein
MTHFLARDPKAHAEGNAGKNVSDWCANCSAPFMDHTNGACPEPDCEVCGGSKIEEISSGHGTVTEVPCSLCSNDAD